MGAYLGRSMLRSATSFATYLCSNEMNKRGVAYLAMNLSYRQYGHQAWYVGNCKGKTIYDY